MNFYDDIDVFGDATAVITENAEYCTYSELLTAAERVREQIKTRCLVFCLCENNLESIVGYVGFLRGRIVPVLLNARINKDFLEKLLRHYRPAYVWLPSDKAREAAWGSQVYSHGRFSLLKTAYGTDYALHEDLALLLTTSGSTGSSKMVRQSYRNIDSNAAAIAQYLEIDPSDRPITTLPMSYTYGLSIINSHFLKGCPVIMTGKTLMEKGFWQLLKSEAATTFGGVPYVYEMLKKLRFARMALPSLRVLTQAGGKLGYDLAKEFAAICAEKSIRFFVMYGQTEATARMSYLPSEYAIAKAGSMGIPIPGGEFWLETENGEVITEDGAVGELVYKGDNVAMGYAEGWADLGKGRENGDVLKTGDYAKRDADGFYYIVGRKKRFLKLFGNRVNLDEVEQLVRDMGYNCACTGEDDRLRIFATDREGLATIKNFAAHAMDIPPSGLEVVHIERLPRSDAGKILYSELK